jgi:hypothetical protein
MISKLTGDCNFWENIRTQWITNVFALPGVGGVEISYNHGTGENRKGDSRVGWNFFFLNKEREMKKETLQVKAQDVQESWGIWRLIQWKEGIDFAVLAEFVENCRRPDLKKGWWQTEQSFCDILWLVDFTLQMQQLDLCWKGVWHYWRD